MNAEELQKKIYETMEALDNLILPQPDPKTGEFPQTGTYAGRRANSEFMKKKEDFVVSKGKSELTGSDASRETTVKASEEYKDHLWGMTTARGLSLQVEAEKVLMEKKLDAYRTLLSYEKEMITKGK